MWLDEIEEKLHDGMLRDNENEERMARVLRETVAFLNLFMNYADVVHEGYAEATKQAWNNLSDDAKKLIKDKS